MAKRIYILPVERNSEGNARGPKYFQWSRDPDVPLFVTQWSMMDYGNEDVAILVAELSDEQQVTIAALSDVIVIPVDLKTTLTADDVTKIKTYLGGYSVPTYWITTSYTYHSFLRTLMGLFQFAQRYHGITKTGKLSADVGNLKATYSQISKTVKDNLISVAESFEYNADTITASTKYDVLLKSFADQWGNKPFYLGGLTF